MTAQNFLLALTIGSALVAFWLVSRFPERAPENFRVALIHVGAALALGWMTPAAFGVFVSWGHAMAMGAIFGLVFPVLVYTFLSGAWVLKLAHDAFGHYRR